MGKCPGEYPWVVWAHVQIPMQDCKSLCVAVMICTTQVNIHRQTDRQTDTQRQTVLDCVWLIVVNFISLHCISFHLLSCIVLFHCTTVYFAS